MSAALEVPMSAITLPVDVEKQLANYPEEDVFDGNTAASHVAYACTDASFIYPISPSTPMAEIYEVWSNAKRKNVFGQISLVKQLQSEAGAAGAVHGSVSVGALTTTFTASQGLLLMIPPMYRIAGELMPCVFHVAARAVNTQALSIFGDHSDVMAVRQCGWALLASASVQEAQDLALVAHMATIDSQVPFVHFFDGFRTSHEIQKIKLIDYLTMRKLLNWEAIEKFRARSLNPTHPVTKGTAQGPEVYFQNVETCNRYYNECAGHVERAMILFKEAIGREYKIMQYYGAADAEDVIVIMGSGAPIVEEAIDHMIEADNEKVGVVVVKLYRPWSYTRFIEAMPSTTKRIAVLDRCKEPGSLGEPLYLDVAASIQRSKFHDALVIGGRYGLGSRDFNPAMVMAIYENLRKPEPVRGFTVGINDDVTNLSLDYSPYAHVDCVPAGTTQCLFWGMGSDGTVGANKNVIKILGSNTDMQVQGYFAYSAHKAGGITVSHLRFGPKRIKSQYLLQDCDYIAVHRAVYCQKYDVSSKIKEGGIFVLNSECTDEQLESFIPGQMKRLFAERNVRFHVIDADKVAAENGMGRRINNVLMTSFFKLSGVLPFVQAIDLFKYAIKKTYGKKGMHIVEANWKCVDAAVAATRQVAYDREAWLKAPDSVNTKELIKQARVEEPPSFVTNVMVALESAAGEDIPVSVFAEFAGGAIPPGTAGYEKRSIALNVPIVDMDKCTQCNQCAFVCPHAAIRPFLLDDDEAEKAPDHFVMKKCKGPGSLAQYKFRIQVAPQDCTGCELCFIACPDDALKMIPLNEAEPIEKPNWDFAVTVKEKEDEFDDEGRVTLKGSQFYTPLMEFSGACAGCGETPYVKLLTQLFGERLVIANATGCSSIWGASYPANAYTTNQKGLGPAWGNSLFEDNAEYGFGMALSTAQRRERLRDSIQMAVSTDEVVALLSDDVKQHLANWLLNWKNANICSKAYNAVKEELPELAKKHNVLRDIYTNMDLLPRISIWIVGGDGWAYDIGFGGVDHVVASGVDCNILILDTEVYSNTGGQTSKATPLGAVHKFAAGGRLRNKKDLGALCMEYGDVYVASICSSANMTQTVRAFVEAESFEGTSIVMAYSPCIEHQYIKPFNLQIEHCKLTVDSGYWPLYRYDPRLLEKGSSAFQLDSKKIKADIVDVIRKENRYAVLRRANPALAEDLENRLREWVKGRFERNLLREAGDKLTAHEDHKPEDTYNVIYGTDTGTAESLANRIASLLADRGLYAKVHNFADVTVDEVAAMVHVLIVCATSGQGQIPPNAKAFWDELNSGEYEHNTNLFENVRFSVMGLGDSAYVFFNQAAKKFDAAFARLGGRRVADLGLGDDQSDEGWEAGFQDWFGEYKREAALPPVQNANDDPLPCKFELKETDGVTASEWVHHDGFQPITIVTNRRLTPADYEVDIRHVEFDISGTGFKYALGDSLAMIPRNSIEGADMVCKRLNVNPETVVTIQGAANTEISKKYGAVFQRPISYRQLFTDVLDVFGKPTRQFYENVYRYATDPKEKETLKNLVPSGEWKTYAQKECVHYLDVLTLFPSVNVTPLQLIDLVPILKPRYYSIASAQKAVGGTSVHLCIGINTFTALGSQTRTGLMTADIARAVPPCKVNAALKPTAFNLPPSEEHPMIVAGMGTGLAPFRSFIQHRAYLKSTGKKCGPISVYFGCRYRSKDWLYAEELQMYKEEGVISELEVAFSRDQKEKDYIQHHIVKNGANFYQRMVVEDGYFYLCGSAKSVPIDVRRAVRQVLMEHGGMTEEKAEVTITDWQVQGKYNVEAW